MWLVIAIVVALSSCGEVKEEFEANYFFDSEEYAKNELIALKSGVSSFNKIIVLNGQNETLENNTADSTTFEEMDVLLGQLNINKAKFIGEYTVDTFWMLDPISSENIEVLNYTSSNPDLKVKWLQVYSNGSVKGLLGNENLLFSYEKEIFYEKGNSFSVISWQKTLSQDSLHLFSKLDFF